MLSNRIYPGEIVHEGACYPGLHFAIVDEALFSEVQTLLNSNRIVRAAGSGNAEASLLTGLAIDAAGDSPTPTFSVKNDTRYRYYVSHHLVTGPKSDEDQRIPASALERLVRNAICDRLADPVAMLDASGRSIWEQTPFEV